MKSLDVSGKKLSLTIGLKLNTNRMESHLAFQNESELDMWLKNDLKNITKGMNNVSLTIMALDGLKVGDECQIYGEGSDRFTVNKMIQYDKGVYVLVMNTGEHKSVLNCFKNLDLKVSKSLLSPTKMKKLSLQDVKVVFRN